MRFNEVIELEFLLTYKGNPQIISFGVQTLLSVINMQLPAWAV